MFNCITFASLYICTTNDIIRLVCLYQAISCLEMACFLLSQYIMYASSRCRTAILLARSFIFETSIWSDVQMYIHSTRCSYEAFFMKIRQPFGVQYMLPHHSDLQNLCRSGKHWKMIFLPLTIFTSSILEKLLTNMFT